MNDTATARFSLYTLGVWIALSVATIAVYVRAEVPQIDFPYCAGAVLNAHENPYLAMPLGQCESRVTGGNEIPMPLPPYALAAFRPIAAIPYPVAAQLWRATVIAATVLTIAAIGALTRLPAAVVCASIVPIALRETVPLGQLYPLVLAALAGAAWAFDRDRPVLGGALAALAMIEPNLGLPACLAAFIIVPRSRATLLIGLALAAVLCVVTVPAALTSTYVSGVLPAQAASEVHWLMQYSATHIAAVLGLADRWALMLGAVLYVVMLAGAIVLAQRLERRGTSRAVVILLPASAVLLGGTYTHVWQYATGAALALWLSTSTQPMARRLGIASAVLLSTAWLEAGFLATAVFAVAATFTIVGYFSRRLVVAVAAASAVAIVCYGVTFVQPMVRDVAQNYQSSDAYELAQAPWSRYVAAANPPESMVALLLQLPTWTGLIIVVAGCARTLRRS